ncbi:MAG: FkbM family methyltransferase [Candidatus Thorarchaeota archaeon]|jgi:FkbM family methyltransferase
MKVFVDAGANDSCSARIFRKLYDPKNKYVIYSFEVEPDFKNNFNNISNLVFINKAVWIEDGHINFYRDNYVKIVNGRCGKLQRAGGSLIKEKKSGNLDKKNPIKVESIDFSKWLRETLSKDDYIILKMDIEGAEYKVLEKMLKEKTFEYINRFMIEWHWKKIGMSVEDHNKIASQIPRILIEKWPGVEQAIRILGKGYRKEQK